MFADLGLAWLGGPPGSDLLAAAGAAAWPLTLVAARVGALVAVAPWLGLRPIGALPRIALTLALTLLLAPLHGLAGAPFPGWEPWAAQLARELMIGGACGGAWLAVVVGLRAAGELVAGGARAGSAAADDAGARLLELTGVAVLLASGGHRLLLAALLDTFTTAPPGAASPAPSVTDVLGLVSLALEFGLRAAAPVVVASLGAQLSLAALARVAPTLRSAAATSAGSAIASVGALLLLLGAIGLLAERELPRLLDAALASPAVMEPGGGNGRATP